MGKWMHVLENEDAVIFPCIINVKGEARWRRVGCE
jgi:hypothetical protein